MGGTLSKTVNKILEANNNEPLTLEAFVKNPSPDRFVRIPFFGEQRICQFSKRGLSQYSTKILFPELLQDPEKLMCVTFLQNPEKQTVWLSAAVYIKKNFIQWNSGGKTPVQSGFTVDEPGIPISYLLIFAKGDKETNLDPWLKERPPGFFGWPKEWAMAFCNACIDCLINLELPSEDRPKYLYTLIEKLVERDKTHNRIETTKSIGAIVKTALSMKIGFQSFKAIQKLIGGVKKQKDITIKQIASFCLATGRLPQAEELSTKNSYNNKKADIIR